MKKKPLQSKSKATDIDLPEVVDEYSIKNRRSQFVQYMPTLDRRTYALAIGSFFFTLLLALLFITSAPSAFPSNTRIEISEGSSLSETATLLNAQSVIRSKTIFKAILHFRDGGRRVKAGVYMFPQQLSVFDIARAVTTGLYEVPPHRITIFEGMRVEQIADILEHELTIDRDSFIELAMPHEGYLFPDTYFIPDAYTEENIVELMQDNFNEQIAALTDQIASSTLSLEEIVVFASILEREARSEESMRTVAGILNKRMSIGMPLQVDATFAYLLDKESAELTLDDLDIDSPFNTYNNLGLPPLPIANPGLKAIEAVLNPIETDYLFYLTSPDGTFHYAVTHDQHLYNKTLYLR